MDNKGRKEFENAVGVAMKETAYGLSRAWTGDVLDSHMIRMAPAPLVEPLAAALTGYTCGALIVSNYFLLMKIKGKEDADKWIKAWAGDLQGQFESLGIKLAITLVSVD